MRAVVIGASLGGAVLSIVWAAREIDAAPDTHVPKETQRVAQVPVAAESEIAPPSSRVEEHRIPAGSSQSAVVLDTPQENLRSNVSVPGKFVDARTVVMSDPSLQNLYLNAERAKLPARYAAVWENIGLSAKESDQLRDLIMQRDEKRLDLDAIVRSNQLNAHDPAIARLRAEAERTLRAAVIQLLGESAYLEFARYERALPVWQFVNEFAGTVALEGQPLTGAQAVQLSETLASASPAYQAGGQADPNTIDWLAVLPASAAILNEPQQASFLNTLPQYPTIMDHD